MSWYLESFFWWTKLPSNWRDSFLSVEIELFFTWVSKHNRFYITARLLYYYMIGLQELAPILQPMTSKTKTSRASLASVFPRLKSATRDDLEFWSVRIVCVQALWLARLIYFGFWVSTQSIPNRSNTKTKVIASFSFDTQLKTARTPKE